MLVFFIGRNSMVYYLLNCCVGAWWFSGLDFMAAVFSAVYVVRRVSQSIAVFR